MQHHIDYCVAQLSIGVDPSWPATTLADYNIPEATVLAIPAVATFDPEGSYCPQSDIPDEVRAVGVHYVGEKIYIAGDNGDCLFVFRLTANSSID